MSLTIRPYGPENASIAIVGDYPHSKDIEYGLPFMSQGGQELTRMLEDAGISRTDCYLTTVFKEAPIRYDIKNFCDKKVAVGGKNYTLPPISTGNYIRPEFLHYLDELREELTAIRPNIVIALGNVATWALLSSAQISKERGIVSESTLVPGLKVLPTYHPASIFKAWGNRPIVILDLMKAKKESRFPETIRPFREIWIRPELADLEIFYEKYLKDAEEISLDIETERKQITCIGFAANKEIALVIPFVDKEQKGFSYWRSPSEEIAAWNFVKKICSNEKAKFGQNGLYDLQYLWKLMGIPVINYDDDTMLMFHSLYSELPKGLGFLASVFTNEASWKGMHHVKTKEQNAAKKDD